MRVAIRPLSGCALASADGGSVLIGDFAGLPEAALVRGVAAGSFEQVTLRLSILHALAALGVVVINDARAIERCVDKAMTSFCLARAGLTTPPTLASESADVIARWRAEHPDELVIKPLFGSQGRGLARVPVGAETPDAEPYAGVRYLQRFAPPRSAGWRDFRVFVVGGEPVAAMSRHALDWITNVARGGRCVAEPADGPMADLAVAAARAVGASYAGVDIIEDRDGLSVLEVNSMPAWSGLQAVTDTDIAGALIDHVDRVARGA